MSIQEKIKKGKKEKGQKKKVGKQTCNIKWKKWIKKNKS